MPVLSHLHQLFSGEQCQAYIHTLRWKDRPLWAWPDDSARFWEEILPLLSYRL